VLEARVGPIDAAGEGLLRDEFLPQRTCQADVPAKAVAVQRSLDEGDERRRAMLAEPCTAWPEGLGATQQQIDVAAGQFMWGAR